MKAVSTLAAFALLSIAAIPASAAASYCNTVAGNLVANCGFETGDFTGWTQGGNTGATSVTNGAYVNSGNYGAALGPVGSDGTLTQTLATLPGTVDVSFYLYNDGGTPNDFTVNWDGIDVGPNLVNAGAFAYQQYSGVLTSTGGDTIQFVFRQDPAYFGLDDVVVTQATSTTPEPGTVGMVLAGLGMVIAGIRRRV